MNLGPISLFYYQKIEDSALFIMTGILLNGGSPCKENKPQINQRLLFFWHRPGPTCFETLPDSNATLGQRRQWSARSQSAKQRWPNVGPSSLYTRWVSVGYTTLYRRRYMVGKSPSAIQRWSNVGPSSLIHVGFWSNIRRNADVGIIVGKSPSAIQRWPNVGPSSLIHVAFWSEMRRNADVAPTLVRRQMRRRRSRRACGQKIKYPTSQQRHVASSAQRTNFTLV